MLCSFRIVWSQMKIAGHNQKERVKNKKNSDVRNKNKVGSQLKKKDFRNKKKGTEKKAGSLNINRCDS